MRIKEFSTEKKKCIRAMFDNNMLLNNMSANAARERNLI